MTVLPFATQIKNGCATIKRDGALEVEVTLCVRGVISPLLANVALDGMERLFGAEDKRGRYVPPSFRRGSNRGISLVRYADDRVPRTY
jgi:hypothetical protein